MRPSIRNPHRKPRLVSRCYIGEGITRACCNSLSSPESGERVEYIIRLNTFPGTTREQLSRKAAKPRRQQLEPLGPPDCALLGMRCRAILIHRSERHLRVHFE